MNHALWLGEVMNFSAQSWRKITEHLRMTRFHDLALHNYIPEHA